MRRVIAVGGGILLVGLVIVVLTRAAGEEAEVASEPLVGLSEPLPPPPPPETNYPLTDPDVPPVPAGFNMLTRLTCPPGDGISHGYHDPAGGTGDPTPESALWSFLYARFPKAPPDFRVTGRSEDLATLENGRAVLLAAMTDPGKWNVIESAQCDITAGSWLDQP